MNTINDIVELLKNSNNSELEKIINANPSLAESHTEQGISLLQFAAYCRNKNAVSILRKHKKALSIFESSSLGEIEIVEKELGKNSEIINSFSPDGFTALGLASFFGHYNITELLLEKGANPNVASNNQFHVAPIHSACAISNYNIVEILIKKGADVNAKQMQGVTALHSAAHNGQTDIARLLIENGAEINAKTESGQTPLFMAQEKKFNETTGLLIQSGAQ